MIYEIGLIIVYVIIIIALCDALKEYIKSAKELEVARKEFKKLINDFDK